MIQGRSPLPLLALAVAGLAVACASETDAPTETPLSSSVVTAGSPSASPAPAPSASIGPPFASAVAPAAVHRAGQLYFYDDNLLKRRASPSFQHLHFIPSLSKDGTMVAAIVSQDDVMEVLEPQELLVRRVSDDAELRRFELSTKESGELESASDEAARAAPVRAIRAAVDAANAWLRETEWQPLDLCAGPLSGDLARTVAADITCRQQARVAELSFVRSDRDTFSAPSYPPTLQIQRASGSLRRDVRAWFPWFGNDERSHCRWPEVEAWARPRADGSLVVFTVVQVGGACQEPMSDFHMLPLPR